MAIPKTVQEHPIKILASILTLVSMLVGGVLTIDSRYAKASDFEEQQQIIHDSAKQNKIEFNYSIDQLRKQTLDDKIFEIELIPENKRTAVDKARLEKFKRDAQAIDIKWQNKDDHK